MQIDIFQQQPVLENERVLLRPIEESDFENLLPFSLNEPETWFYDINTINITSQLGFTWYGKAFQRTGLNRHCKLLLLTFAFEVWGLERLEFRADAKNTPSINAMKAIGCIEEGIFRNHMPTTQGGRRDSIVLSILKDEWFGGVKERLEQKTR